MILVAALNQSAAGGRYGGLGGRVPRSEEHRTPLKLVSDANAPRTALMNFIAEKLEEAGFELRTSDWPRIRVLVNGHEYLIAEGASCANAQQIATALRRVLSMVENP